MLFSVLQQRDLLASKCYSLLLPHTLDFNLQSLLAIFDQSVRSKEELVDNIIEVLLIDIDLQIVYVCGDVLLTH